MDTNFVFHLVYCLPAEAFLALRSKQFPCNRLTSRLRNKFVSVHLQGKSSLFCGLFASGFKGRQSILTGNDAIQGHSNSIQGKTHLDAAAKHFHKMESAFFCYQVFSFLCSGAKNSVWRQFVSFFHTSLTFPGITASSL